MAATERIPVQVTKAEKAKIARKAKEADMTMGEYLRRAAEAFEPLSKDELGIINALVRAVQETTAEANKALDETTAACAESNRRIAQMEADHAARKRPQPIQEPAAL